MLSGARRRSRSCLQAVSPSSVVGSEAAWRHWEAGRCPRLGSGAGGGGIPSFPLRAPVPSPPVAPAPSHLPCADPTPPSTVGGFVLHPGLFLASFQFREVFRSSCSFFPCSALGISGSSNTYGEINSCSTKKVDLSPFFFTSFNTEITNLNPLRSKWQMSEAYRSARPVGTQSQRSR